MAHKTLPDTSGWPLTVHANCLCAMCSIAIPTYRFCLTLGHCNLGEDRFPALLNIRQVHEACCKAVATHVI